MHIIEEENIIKRLEMLEKQFEKMEQLVQNLSCRIEDLEDEIDEPSHSKGWYWI